MGFSLHFEVQDNGIAFTLVSKNLLGRQSIIPIDQWEKHTLKINKSSIGLLLRLHEEYPGPTSQNSLILYHQTIANLSQSEAFLLDLPSITPMHLFMQSNGNISDSNFHIETSWISPQGVRAIITRKGAMLRDKGKWQRLPSTLYALIEAIDAHNALPPDQHDERRKYLACITEELPEDAQKQIRKDGFLTSLRVYHASALSLELTSNNQDFDFLPQLFGKESLLPTKNDEEDYPETTQELLPKGHDLLPKKYKEKFEQHFSHTYSFTRPSYSLGDNRFVFLEPMLQDALEVVRTMRYADKDIKREFIRTPQRFFKEKLADKYDEAVLEAMFVPTQDYSDRVVGFKLWNKKVLPWIHKSSNTWIPESYGIMTDDEVMVIPDATTAEQILHTIEQAISEGKETVVITAPQPDDTQLDDFPAQYKSTNVLEVSATEDTAKIVASILNICNDKKKSNTDDRPVEHDKLPTKVPTFLDISDNIENTKYHKFQPRQPVDIEMNTPIELMTPLKPHQVEAFHWLIHMWSEGYSGALLADDMGLGKTLSCLCFLAWLRERRKNIGNTRLPMLIVAPMSLLSNWQDEANKHLSTPNLGHCIVVHGEQLKRLRLPQANRGRDIDDGTSRLDATLMQKSDWLITTYETLRDYHHSFATVPFAAIVFDEMQKAKNCTSQISCAIRTLNSEFCIGLTGTPIENSLTDMWSIMDVLLPGFLGELRQFNSNYANADENKLKELKTQLEGTGDQSFRPMLRRMKSNTLQGLPKKLEHIYKNTMPDIQAQAYEDAMCKSREPLRLLQALRMISLHPLSANNTCSSTYVSASARFSKTLDIIDMIHKKHEKVLLFLESLEHQPLMAALLQEHYQLPQLPRIISGKTSQEKRLQYVKEFQENRNCFGVIILSPKAAGVGLTLTAANHVIHLSRWWNPAVEDQCTDRAYRLGQDRDVHVYFPLAIHPQPHLENYSFDLQLHELLEQKRNLSRDILLPPQEKEMATELFTRITANHR